MNSEDVLNPYRSKNPIKAGYFFGRKREVLTLYDCIESGGTKGSPESVSIVGESRIGKDTLLRYVYDKGNRRKYLPQSESYVFTFIDFSLLTLQPKDVTPAVFFRAILTSLEKELGSKLDTDGNLENFKRTINEIAKDKKVVVFLNEFDLITQNPNFETGFFLALRGMAQDPKYRMGIITSSVRNLWELVHDFDLAASPFFNIFTPIFLKPFRRDDALSFIKEPFRKADLPLGEKETKFALDLGGYHPFFLRIACRCLFDIRKQKDHLDASDFEDIRAQFEEESQLHFKSIWTKLSEKEKPVIKAISKNKAPKKYDSDIIRVLQGKGYLIEHRIFSSLFSDFIRQVKFSNNRWKFIIRKNKSTLLVVALTGTAVVVSFVMEIDELKRIITGIGVAITAIVTLINNIEELRQKFSDLFKIETREPHNP